MDDSPNNNKKTVQYVKYYEIYSKYYQGKATTVILIV